MSYLKKKVKKKTRFLQKKKNTIQNKLFCIIMYNIKDLG